MNYKTKTYLTGVTNLSDARFAAGSGVDFIGFCVDDAHESSISLETFEAIINWIQGMELVGEFYEKSNEEINDLVSKYGLKFIQLPLNRASDIKKINATVILKDSVDADTFNHRFDKTNLNKKSFLHINSAKELKNIDLNSIFGISISGEAEERSGFKDYDTIAEILENLEV